MSLFAEKKRFFAVSKVAVYSLSEMKILSVSYMSCSESLLKTKKKEANKTYFGEVILCQLKIAEQERPQSALWGEILTRSLMSVKGLNGKKVTRESGPMASFN